MRTSSVPLDCGSSSVMEPEPVDKKLAVLSPNTDSAVAVHGGPRLVGISSAVMVAITIVHSQAVR